MSDYRQSLRGVTNTITIRGLDTISISPESFTKLKCVGSDRIFDNVEDDSESEECEEVQTLSRSNTPHTSFHHPLLNAEVVHSRVRPRGECEYFLDYEEFTHMFVDEILETAVDVVRNKNKEAMIIDFRRQSSSRNIPSWPVIEEFDVRLGAAKLREYIDSTSEVTEDWMYSISLIAEQSSSVSDSYKYEAKFGIPTRCYPIPQATASVYFTYEVSRVKPTYCPVDVTYQYEASSCVMVPGRNYITEELLFRIVDAKIAYFKRVRF